MHQLNNIKHLSHLNLVTLENRELQIVKHDNVFVLKWDFENVLAREFLSNKNKFVSELDLERIYNSLLLENRFLTSRHQMRIV